MFSLVRLRRHRVTIVIAIFIIVVLYQLSSLRSSSESHGAGYDRLKEYTRPAAPKPKLPPPVKQPPTHDVQVEVPLVEEKPKEDKPKVEKPADKPEKPVEKPKEDKLKEPAKPVVPATTASSTSSRTTTAAAETPKEAKPIEEPEIPQRPGGHQFHDTVDEFPVPTATKEEHYSFPTPFYRLPSPLISIPPALSAEIPQIQADFAPEADEIKMIRLERQAAVKSAFLVSWNTYKRFALPHDELRPVTLAHKDPFGGWGATLVDALDTLWIMGLKEDFDEAVQLVAKIDFTTNQMKKMKVFETVIRYLGGLVGAWDLATEGGQGKAYKNGDKQGYKVLLDQAKNLADILLGAFDTPNRMPILSWGWRVYVLTLTSSPPAHMTDNYAGRILNDTPAPTLDLWQRNSAPYRSNSLGLHRSLETLRTTMQLRESQMRWRRFR